MIAQPQPLIEVFAEIQLSPPSGQTPSLARYTLAGLLCDVVWLSQL